MEADTIALWTLLITTLGTIITAYFKSSIATIKNTVRHQGEKIERLESANTELRQENKSLRVKIEEYQEKVENLLRQLAGKDNDSGVF